MVLPFAAEERPVASTEGTDTELATVSGARSADSEPSQNRPFQYAFGTDDPRHTDSYLYAPLLKLIGRLEPGTRVLDVGCGSGTL